jgi:hypothetical protein
MFPNYRLPAAQDAIQFKQTFIILAYDDHVKEHEVPGAFRRTSEIYVHNFG